MPLLQSCGPRIGAALTHLAFAMLDVGVAAAQNATLTGRVTAAGSGAAIQETRVVVAGTNLGAISRADGRYTIRNVPAGRYTVRALRDGYVEGKETLRLFAGEAALDFVLVPSRLQRQEVVTTPTGEQRRQELGTSVSTINVPQRIQSAPATDLANLIVAQAAGVQVAPGNTVGTGARVRVRGVNSIALVNDPVYFIDGVRMRGENGSITSSILTGGAAPSRAQDINPDEIESIEIVKGPAASVLYGEDAANGVIVLTSKRGHAGAAKYTVFGESGVSGDFNTYPTAYTLWGHAPPGSTRNCLNPSLSLVSAGSCVSDSLTSFNLFRSRTATPLGTGYRRSAGAQLSGGGQNARVFVSGQFDNETGVLKLPDFDITRLDSLRIPIRNEWRRPSEQTRASFRVNLDAAISPRLDAQFSSGFTHQLTRLPVNDNSVTGLLGNALRGPGYESGHGRAPSARGFDLHGYRNDTPAETFQIITPQRINRAIGSGSLAYRPTSWLTLRGGGGADYTERGDQQYCAPNSCPRYVNPRGSFLIDYRALIRTASLDWSGTITVNPRPGLVSRSTAGTQWNFRSFESDGSVTSGNPLLRDTESLHTERNTFGAFVEQQLAMGDRLFLSGALRSDQHSVGGTTFERVVFPRFSASYLLSNERWFAPPRWLRELRLRAAYGTAGMYGGLADAVQSSAAPPAFLGSILRPERTSEFESGVDAGFFDNRLRTDITYYRKLTTDALSPVPAQPGLGGSPSGWANLGAVQNTGIEATISASLVSRPNVGWDATLVFSRNANKLVSLGPRPTQVGVTFRNQVGYPLFGYWQRKIRSFSDRNGDGIITLDEIVVDDSDSFVGYPSPRYEAGLSNSLDLLGKRLRLSMTFDYKGGYSLLNHTESLRCERTIGNCSGVNDRTATLWQQARAIAAREHPSGTRAGYVEDASFVRFRELSASYQLPSSLVSRSRVATDARLTLDIYNLHKWTNYTGIDPESNFTASSDADSPRDLFTLPPASYFILRLTFGF